jgi:hypothetical protein
LHRSDQVLKELEDHKEVKVFWYNGFKVYVALRLCKGGTPNIPHGLGVAECLARIWLSDKSGEIVPQRRFKGAKVVPDVGFLYGEKLLLVEYGTPDNSKRWAIITGKIDRYRHAFPQAWVLFVLDTKREKVGQYAISQYGIGNNFYFTDFETFKSVSIGQALTARIYFGDDGQEYPLRKDEPVS